ncbi:MAG: hydroxymethylpyrimidine/phosphomethylpyrimidine kinase [Gammaproteobacteria bacterium]|jgi:hydroxymethylpyrimidine/phosphomethylpyrimidine kinase
MPDSPTIPLVLSISGHDPGGGAGIQADIEAIAANGCHACSVITCLTEQDTCEVRAVHPQSAARVLAQATFLLADSRVSAIKIGLLGEAEIAAAVADLLDRYPERPVVLDPVLASGAGKPLGSEALLKTMRERLLPRASLITPNGPEARALAPEPAHLDGCAAQLLELGCEAVLITGGHERAARVVNRLYRRGAPPRESAWERLPGSYHGSGCTLASAIASRLALGEPLAEATARAQRYTWQTLARGLRSGRCQSIPDRLFALQRSAPR